LLSSRSARMSSTDKATTNALLQPVQVLHSIQPVSVACFCTVISGFSFGMSYWLRMISPSFARAARVAEIVSMQSAARVRNCDSTCLNNVVLITHRHEERSALLLQMSWSSLSKGSQRAPSFFLNATATIRFFGNYSGY